MSTQDLYARWRLPLTWAALAAWSALIWVSNTRPGTIRTASDFWNDVIWQGGHLLAHVVLGALAWRAATLAWGHRRGYWIALAASFAHAVLDELVQRWVPTRHPNAEDVLTNLAGCAMGIALAEYLRLRAEARAAALPWPQNRARASDGEAASPIPREGERGR